VTLTLAPQLGDLVAILSTAPRRLLTIFGAALCPLLLAWPHADAALDIDVQAADETDPVSHGGDSADDPAIWRAPDDPSRSLIIGTDKNGALETYDLQGNRLQRISGTYPDNVDLRGDVVATSDDESGRMRFYRIAHSTRRLAAIGTIRFPPANLEYGICLYQSGSGTLYAFLNVRGGVVQQWRLDVRPSNVTGSVVRSFDVGSRVEGCAADDDRARFYIAEQNVGVWRYGAEPNQGTARVLVDSTDAAGHLVAEVEGITLVDSLMIVSSQGGSFFAVYDRAQNQYLGRFSVGAGSGADGCSGTDGIDAYGGNLGPDYPSGIFVCQDHTNTAPGSTGNQNFKYVDLASIAGPF
jgi:3-phytase